MSSTLSNKFITNLISIKDTNTSQLIVRTISFAINPGTNKSLVKNMRENECVCVGVFIHKSGNVKLRWTRRYKLLTLAGTDMVAV